MKNKYFLFSLIFLVTFKTISQENQSEIHVKSQFSVSLLQGFLQTKYNDLYQILPKYKPNHISSYHILQFKYKYNFYNKLSLEASIGLGKHFENLNPPTKIYNDFGLFNPYAISLSRMELNAGYNFFQNKNKYFDAKLGFGWNKYRNNNNGLYGGSFGSNNELLNVNLVFANKMIPFFNLGVELRNRTKRKDEISVYLGYQYSFNPFFYGSYLYNNIDNLFSIGSIENKLSSFQFGLGYTFTRLKKIEHITNLIISGEESSNIIKKKDKFERRSINPKSRYISLDFGLAKSINQFPSNNLTFSSPNFSSYITRLNYEHGLKINFFFEVDYHFFTFWEGARYDFNTGIIGAFGGNIFIAQFINMGISYKIQNPKTNFQFFNLHAGIGLGYNARNKGEAGNGSVSLISSEFSYHINYTSEVRGNVMPIIYTGISKDLRITEKLAINLAYRYQFGFVDVYSSTYNYTTTNNPEIQTIDSKTNGTAFFYQMGLKYRIK